MNLFAGVDGGATHTVVLVTDEQGRALVRENGPPALIRTQPAAVVAEQLVERVASALKRVGETQAESTCFALTGVGRDAERTALEAELAGRVPSRNWRLVTDAEAALEDAFGQGPGIVLIGGTGSVAWARHPDGSVTRAGGWGPILGDEGSGFAIGLAALRATVRAADGRGPPTAISTAVLAASGVNHVDQLVQWSDNAQRSAIAALAPAVLALADRDPVAGEITAGAARELAHLVTPLRPSMPEPAIVALAGGLLTPGSPLRERTHALLRAVDGVRILETTVDGARGAAAIARRTNGTSRQSPATRITLEE